MGCGQTKGASSPENVKKSNGASKPSKSGIIKWRIENS
jgi:hypothetical protein